MGLVSAVRLHRNAAACTGMLPLAQECCRLHRNAAACSRLTHLCAARGGCKRAPEIIARSKGILHKQLAGQKLPARRVVLPESLVTFGSPTALAFAAAALRAAAWLGRKVGTGGIEVLMQRTHVPLGIPEEQTKTQMPLQS